MRHCVATYAERCARRQTSIWSMQMENQRGRHCMLTIEVDLFKRTICQARRKCNRLPSAIEAETPGDVDAGQRNGPQPAPQSKGKADPPPSSP